MANALRTMLEDELVMQEKVTLEVWRAALAELRRARHVCGTT
jgi:hypothetical protein